MIAVTARAQLSCDDVEPLLSPCVDGELLEDDSASVKGHVARCDKCRGRLLELQALKASLRSARSFDLPLDLEARLHANLHRAARPARAMRAGLVAAGVAAIAGVVALALDERGQQGGVAASTAVATSLAPPSISGIVAGARRAPLVIAAMQRHRADLPVDVASPDPRPVQEFLTQRLGHKLRVPRLERFGFGLQGGRIVDVDDRQGAQLMYAGGYGQRLSVVAVPDPDGALAAKLLAAEDAHGDAKDDGDGLNVRVVSNKGAVYTIIGDVDEQRLDRVSHEITH